MLSFVYRDDQNLRIFKFFKNHGFRPNKTKKNIKSASKPLQCLRIQQKCLKTSSVPQIKSKTVIFLFITSNSSKSLPKALQCLKMDSLIKAEYLVYLKANKVTIKALSLQYLK